MTDRLPQCSPKDVARVLYRAGFRLTHQVGSHRHYKDNGNVTLIAFHPGDVPRPTLKQILKQARLSDEQFLALRRGKKAA